MRKAFLAASALTLALSASAWAQSTPPAAFSGLHKPVPSGLVEQNTSAGAIGPNAAAGASTPSAGGSGGATINRATGQVGTNASAGASTPSAGSTGSSVPVRNQSAGLPPVAAGLPQNQYVIQMGERMRQWFPVVDTYLDAGVPTEQASHQVEVKRAWEHTRAEWDELQRADATTWNAARSDFERAYTNFESTWDKAQRKG